MKRSNFSSSVRIYSIYGKTSHGSPHMCEVFLYMGRLRIHGKTSHVSGDFPHMGRLPTYGKTSHIWEDIRYIWGCSPRLCGIYSGWRSAAPCAPPVGRPSACFSLLGFAWPGSRFVALTPPKSLNGVLLITEHVCYNKGFTFHIWEDFPYMGRLPIDGKTSRTWEVPHMGRVPIDGKSSHRWEVFP
jgi:hypothetical protein